jgi:hypothetical protein
MSTDIPCFAAVVVAPGQSQKVTVAEDSVWMVGSVAIVPDQDLAAGARVVVYAASVKRDGTTSKRIAIAPLRVGIAEVATVDYQIGGVSPIVLSTEGAPITVTVTGYTLTSDALLVEQVQAAA